MERTEREREMLDSLLELEIESPGLIGLGM